MGHYYLYFAGFDGKTEQVGVAISTNQVDWKITPEPAIPVGKPGEWDSWQTSNPCVIHENGRFRMWYQGVDDERKYRIGYAESNDGWAWEKHPDILFERSGLTEMKNVPRREGYHQPLVLPEGNRYLMYFLDHRNGLGHVRVAQSSDGLQWNIFPGDCLSPEKSWESHGLHYPWVIKETDSYVMWYTSESKNARWFLSRAVSKDGITWQREPEDRPIIDISLARTVSKFSNLIPRKIFWRYPNYYHPAQRAVLSNRRWPSGKGYLKFHDSVIWPFRNRRFISFENSSVIKQDKNSYLMYFQARNENYNFSIGIATSQDGIVWKPRRMNILRSTIQRHNIHWCSLFDADPHLLLLED